MEGDSSAKKIYLVNYAPPSTSIYKYTGEIAGCITGSSEQINLRYSNRSGKWSLHTQGETFGSPIKNVISVNITLGKFLFRKARKFIKSGSGTNRIVHYTHQTVRPFDFDLDRSVVTVHDNPYAALKYGVYNSPSKAISDKLLFDLYSASIRSNLRRYKDFKHVITITEYVKKSLIQYGFHGEITAIHSPVGNHFFELQDKVALRHELNLPLDKKLLLSVTTDQPRKNLRMIEELMKRLDNTYELVRVGTPISNSVTFSNVSAEKINKIYNACDLMIMPSTEEGYGYPIPEAMAVGLPVVCSDISVFHELAGDSAVYFNPLNAEEFCDAVQKGIEESDELKSRMADKAGSFSYSKFCAKMNEYYDKRF